MKKNYILLYLMIAINSCSGLFSMEEPIQNWVFIKNMPGAADKEDSDVDWRIKNGKLELNLNAPEAMTQQTFAELIAERKNEKLPFLLLIVRSGSDGKFIHFFDGSVMRTLMSGWKKTDTLIDPSNKQKITNIEIYVAGDDGKLRLLNDNVTQNYLLKFVDYKGYTDDRAAGVRMYNYEPKYGLTVPGMAQVFIADLYLDQYLQIRKKNQREKVNLEKEILKLESMEKLEKEIKNLYEQLADLQQKKNTTLSDIESKNLDSQIKDIETKINDIMTQFKAIAGPFDLEMEKLLQLERLWLSWSLDKFSSVKQLPKKWETSERMNQIEYKPQYLQD